MDKDYILEYMPDYYHGVYEMEELLKAQGKALSNFDNLEEKILLNQYIIKADEEGISVFENQYRIFPDLEDDLEVRRQRLLMRVSPPRPITLRFLKQLFKSASIPVDVSVDYGKRELKVVSISGDLSQSQQKLITLTLNSYLPANMIYVYRTWYKTEAGHAYIGSAVQSKVRTVAHAEVLNEAQQREKFYEWNLWQKTFGTNYVGTKVISKVSARVEAERREYE